MSQHPRREEADEAASKTQGRKATPKCIRKCKKKEKQGKKDDGEMSRLSIGQGPEVETRCDDLPHHQNEQVTRTTAKT